MKKFKIKILPVRLNAADAGSKGLFLSKDKILRLNEKVILIKSK